MKAFLGGFSPMDGRYLLGSLGSFESSKEFLSFVNKVGFCRGGNKRYE